MEWLCEMHRLRWLSTTRTVRSDSLGVWAAMLDHMCPQKWAKKEKTDQRPFLKKIYPGGAIGGVLAAVVSFFL